MYNLEVIFVYLWLYYAMSFVIDVFRSHANTNNETLEEIHQKEELELREKEEMEKRCAEAAKRERPEPIQIKQSTDDYCASCPLRHMHDDDACADCVTKFGDL